MKYNFRGLIARVANQIQRKDGGAAYALYELADNISVLLNEKCTLAEFKECYVGFDEPKFIRGGLMPGEKGYDAETLE